jgi:hypothetical protein
MCVLMSSLTFLTAALLAIERFHPLAIGGTDGLRHAVKLRSEQPVLSCHSFQFARVRFARNQADLEHQDLSTSQAHRPVTNCGRSPAV